MTSIGLSQSRNAAISQVDSVADSRALTDGLAADVVPDTGTVSVGEHSWLVVCSDGLWNYASAPAELARQVDAASQPDDDPVRVAARLVAWANTQGGKDNVTVALARLTTNLNGAPQAATTSDSVQEKD